METTLHRQLKSLYAAGEADQEVPVDGYRIDAVVDDRLVEIQYGSLGAIRDKIRQLLKRHDVLVVKPLAARKYLIKRKRKNGRVVTARYSPTHKTVYNLFEDLVHFVGVFPHARLTLEVLLTEQEEHRIVAPKRRRRSKDFRVEDRLMRNVSDRIEFRSANDLLSLLPRGLPDPFTTQDLSQQAEIPRWLAQKMAYCLKKTGVVGSVGKQGNTVLYQVTRKARRAA